MPNLRVTTKLSLALFVLIGLAAAGTAWIVQQERSQALRDRQHAHLAETAHAATRQLAENIDFLRREVRFLAELPPIQGIIRARRNGGIDPRDGSSLAEWKRRLTDILAGLLQTRPGYFQVRFIGAADGGRELVRVEQTADGIQAVPTARLQQKGDRPYFRQAIRLDEGKVYLSEIDLNQEHGRIDPSRTPTLRAAVPVYGPEGTAFGAIVINEDMGRRFQALRASLDRSFTVYLTNDQGDYLYHPEPGKAFGFDLGFTARLQRDRPAAAAFYREGAEQDLGFDTEGRAYHLRRIPFDRGLQEDDFLVLALAAKPEALLGQTAGDTRNRFLLIIAGFGGATLLLGLFFFRRLTAPLTRLARAAEHIAVGHYEIELPEDREGDVAALSEAFRQMVRRVRSREESLQESANLLEQRVAARTEELNRSEQALREQKDLLQLILDNIGEGVVVTDAAGRLLLYNKALTAFVAPHAFELPTERWPEECGVFRDAESGDPIASGDLALTRALADERVDGHEVFLRNDREPGGRWLNCSGRPLRDSEGRFRGAVMTLHDISERKRAEQDLELVARVFEHSVEGILITDPRVRILEVNRAFTRITGYAPEEIIGQTPAVLQSGWQDPQFYKQMWETIGKEGVWQGEIWDRRKNGELYIAWLTICTVRNSEGEVINYIGMSEDITQQKESEEHIRRLAYHDTLTGLANRQLFEDRLAHAVATASRDERPVAVLFIDLDRFKPVNDSLGHKAGDILLQQVAQRLDGIVRESDTVARLGGDEFAIVLEGADEPHADQVAGKVLQAMNDPFELEGHELHVGASIGISLFPDDGRSLETLVQHADIAMYRSKTAGRGTYQFFRPEMNQGAVERLTMENALRHAEERGELELHYQPQFSLADGHMTGAEALLRWRSPERGLVSPGDFIPLAEETGLILPIGKWVLRTACFLRREWSAVVPDDFTVAVNVSAVQFNTELVATVRATLDETGIAPYQLELEVTESTVMHRADDAYRMLQELSQMGVRLSLDDFGTGYSSLAHLKRFPIHKLKVDRSFVTDLPKNEEDAAITTTIVGMAKTLGLRVIAEGVENPQQVRFLRVAGCDEVQGFYCGRPALPADLEELLETGVCTATLTNGDDKSRAGSDL